MDTIANLVLLNWIPPRTSAARRFAAEGPHRVSNGLLLRSDLHRLFDRGYITVDSNLRLEVGNRLREHFENGRSYYPLNGKTISVPTKAVERPDSQLLRWHNDNVFLG